MQDFQLIFWWVLPALVFTGMSLIAGFLFYKRTRNSAAKNSNTVLVANSYRMRNTPAYQKALRKLWVQLIVAAAIFVLSGVAAAFGAARPVAVTVEHPDKHNRDIVLCLDASGSMFDVDIDILKKFDELVDQFKGERVSLTIFNATARQVFPLTDDYDYIKENLQYSVRMFQEAVPQFEGEEIPPEASQFLSSTLGRAEGASLIGDGLYGCSLSFDYKEDQERSRSIILATDNVVNGTELVPLDQAAQDATESNIRVYGINPGSRALGIGYVPDSAINAMKSAVESTKGKFFLLNDIQATATIVDEISTTETTRIQGSPVVILQDTPELVLYAILTLFSAGFLYIVWRKL